MALSDWDIRLGHFELTDEQFVSPPTSASLDWRFNDLAFCRIPGTLNLPQGRIVTWWRSPKDRYPHIRFRAQNPLGNAFPAYYYYCSFVGGPVVNLGKYIPGWNGDIGIWPFAWPSNTWFKVRLTWWILPPSNANRRMMVRFEALEDGEWVSYGDIEDPDANFEDSELNRVGLEISNPDSYNDDYEIWGPC